MTRHDRAVALLDKAFGVRAGDIQAELRQNPTARLIYDCALVALVWQMKASAGWWHQGHKECEDCIQGEDGPACTMNCSSARLITPATGKD